MIAISILTAGFLGIAGLLARSFFISRITSGELTATYLASEGIEVTKNIIDHDVYVPGMPAAWGTCGGNCTADGAYTVEYDSQTLTLVAQNSHCSALVAIQPLRFDATAGLYYDQSTGLHGITGTPTNFTRCIQLAHSSDGNELTVDSVVTWTSGAFVGQNIDLEDHFYNWR